MPIAAATVIHFQARGAFSCAAVLSCSARWNNDAGAGCVTTWDCFDQKSHLLKAGVAPCDVGFYALALRADQLLIDVSSQLIVRLDNGTDEFGAKIRFNMESPLPRDFALTVVTRTPVLVFRGQEPRRRAPAGDGR